MHKKIHSSAGFSSLMIAIGIGVVALVGLGGFYMMRRSTPAIPTSTTPSATTTTDASPTSETSDTGTTTAGEIAGTFDSLISRGQSLECDWRVPVQTEDNPFGAGKLWTTGSQGRSTIMTTINGMTMEANAIYKDNAAYTWMNFNGTKMGFKMSVDASAEAASTMTDQQRQQAEQIRQEMIFNCKPWTVDPSKFVLPTDVEFKEN